MIVDLWVLPPGVARNRPGRGYMYYVARQECVFYSCYIHEAFSHLHANFFISCVRFSLYQPHKGYRWLRSVHGRHGTHTSLRLLISHGHIGVFSRILLLNKCAFFSFISLTCYGLCVCIATTWTNIQITRGTVSRSTHPMKP